MAELFKLGTGGVGRGRKNPDARPIGPKRSRSDWFFNVHLGPYSFKRARLCSDKATSETWADLLQAAVDRQNAGKPPDAESIRRLPRRLCESFELVSELSKKRRATFEIHVGEYVAELRTAGRAPMYVDNVERSLTAVGNDCGWKKLGDANRDAIAAHLATQRTAGRAARTLNNIRATLRAFFGWCVDAKRLDANPCDHVKRIDQTGDRRRVRRAFTFAECVKLLAVAGSRELVYRAALGTGLRRLELKNLQWRDVQLDNGRPCIALRPEATKAKRGDVLPLHRDLADRLRAARPDGVAALDPVFRRVPKFSTWENDLRRAGIEYRAADGSILGFHSLRVTYVTSLQNAGLPPRTVMQLARHTDYRLTATTYTDARLIDTFGAVASLPTYGTEPAVQAALRTGTDDAPMDRISQDQIRDQMARPNAHRGASLCSDGEFGRRQRATGRHSQDSRKRLESKDFRGETGARKKVGVTDLRTGPLGIEPRTF